MATRRWILMLSAAAAISLLAGCGGSTFNVQNPPPPPPSNVTIAFQPQPGSSLAVGFSEDLTAVVSNDPKNLGVSWSLSCQAGHGAACGALSAYNTASGVSTTYTAPSSISGNSALVQIVAEALADTTKNQVAPITITAFDSGLQAGNYVLAAQGNQNGSPYQFAGVITLDGQGNITGGEQTANSNGVSVSDTIVASGSSYFIGNDGRGTITLNTGDNSIGQNGIETFAIVFLNNGPQNPQALISQIDFGSGATGVSATGTMELQTGVAQPSGSYAFVLNGTDVADNGFPLAFGGVFNIPSGQTAISGVVDEVIGEKFKLSDGPFLTGSQVSSPDALGKVTLTLVGVLDGVHPKTVTAALAGYIVDASHIALVESDTDPISGVTALGMTGGLAIAQVAGAYGTFTDASLSGPFVFGVTGVDLSQGNLTPTTWTLAGVTTADGQANLTSGFIDSFLQLNCVQASCKTGGITGGQISAQFTGTYVVDSASGNCGATSGSVVPGTGRACLTPATFTPAPNPTYGPELFFYLTGLTGPGDPAALVLGVGAVAPNPNAHYPSLGTGIAYVQSSAVTTFSGTYGMTFTQQNGGENDGTGQMTVTSSGTTQVSGAGDSSDGTPDDPEDHTFTGGFATPLSTSAFAGSFFDATGSSGPFNANPSSPNNGFSVDYFFIDAEHGFFVETDLINPNPGSSQVGFGYYTARTPVCQGCQ